MSVGNTLLCFVLYSSACMWLTLHVSNLNLLQ